jgi:hypothetical protein
MSDATLVTTAKPRDDSSGGPCLVQPVSRRGQALVETALLLPIILILLLGAIDFGRLFFGYVTLHQAARVAANAASVDPSLTAADIPGVVAGENAVMNCDPLDAPVLVYTRAGAPITNAQIGDFAQVEVSCEFSLITPLANQLFNGPIAMRATATFPVRSGCIGCGPGTGGGEPPPPPPEQCRTAPNMVGMSVGGARNAWASAGFIGAFTSDSPDDTRTVLSTAVTPDDLACLSPQEIFNASVAVTTVQPQTEPPGCEMVPNLVGMTIAQARAAWAATDFDTGEFLPPPPDANALARVLSQSLLQDGAPVTAEPGVTCLDPASDPPLDMRVQLGAAWPNPPPAPCQVPHLIDKQRNVAAQEWTRALFTGSFSPTNGNFKIKSQSLAGFSWVPCESSIVVSQQP